MNKDKPKPIKQEVVSRAVYFRKRREDKKTFGALIDRKKAEEFESILKKKNITKKQWLDSKIDEEIDNSRK